MSEMLTSLNRHLEISNQTRRIIFEAMIYPAVIFVMGSVIMSFALLFLIPKFDEILGEMIGQGQLPTATQVVLGLSHHVGTFWLAAGCIIAAMFFINVLLKSSPWGRRLREKLILCLPGFGQLYHSSILSKMAESMALMVAAGCDMQTCFRLSPDATGSDGLKKEGNFIADRVEQGTGILEAGQFCEVLPRFFQYSIQLGSQRNELQDNLRSLSEMYAQQVRSAQLRLQGLLLPTMIIIVGGFIMLCILSVFLPMIKIITTLNVG